MEREEKALQGDWNVTSSSSRPAVWHITPGEKSEFARDCAGITQVYEDELWLSHHNILIDGQLY